MSYVDFIARKTPRAARDGIPYQQPLAPLFDFQAETVRFCVERGRAGLFLDTGLGKTCCQLEFVRQTAGDDMGLILTPLAVARQIETEGKRFGYDCRVIREQSEARPGINICNYDRLEKLDARLYRSVSLDESSILKAFTGATKSALIEAFRDTPYKLAATATPAPNDHMELGNHAEFLGVMAGNEMLARWFISDQTEMGRYRLKGHARMSFYDWMASWAIMASSPADLGFDGSRFVLPTLNVVRHRVVSGLIPKFGLFQFGVSATEVHDLKRQTAGDRAVAAAEAVARESDEQWLIWVDTNYEADAVRAVMPNAIEIRGTTTERRKETRLDGFTSGAVRTLIVKPTMFGRGMNWQNCARMVFVGRSFSYETWYQAIRRCWRFGQTRDVTAHLIVAEGEDQIGRVIDRKAEDHVVMKEAMRAAQRRMIRADSEVKASYQPSYSASVPQW